MKLCNFNVGLDQPLFLIAGPCVIESEDMTIDVAGQLKEMTNKLKIPFIFTNHTYQTQSFISQQVAGGGTGPEYAASIVLFLGKAQLKEGGEKTGIIVTAKPNKNRFAKPSPIKFHLHFTEGMNRYVGLEQYIDWEEIGIAKGSIEKGIKIPKATARGWICKHLDKVVPNNEFFSDKVFTPEILQKIEKIIHPIFNYSTEHRDLNVDELLDLEDED